MVEQTTIHQRSKLRPLHLVLGFLVGLLLGWLVLGWVVWPVEWIDAVPANLQPEDQRQFVILVAGEYAQSGDTALARARLVSWDEASLATLLTMMEQQASNEATAAALANLRQALAVPPAELTFWDTLFEQKLVVISALLGGLVLLTAVALTIYPSLRRNQKRRARQRQLEAEEEALLQAARAAQLAEAMAQAADETAAATPVNQPTEQAAVVETAVQAQPQPPEPAANKQSAQPELQQNQADPQQAAAPPNEAQNGQNQPQAAEAVKPNEAPSAAKPGEQPANPPQPETAAPAPKPLLTEEESEEEEAEASNSIQDLLNSVFEDDDEAAHYESLLKGLDDINIMKLIKDVDYTAQQLRERRSKMKTATSASPSGGVYAPVRSKV